MPLYMALIYSPADYEEVGELRREVMAEYTEFEEAARGAGVLRAGHELDAVDTAVTVRSGGGRGGMRILSDGPFAETKEVLGGYFILECEDHQEAIGWASRIPAAWRGAVEVRPVIDFGQE